MESFFYGIMFAVLGDRRGVKLLFKLVCCSKINPNFLQR